ncbi:hypothetical protein HMPREF9628_00151 [Peptoanaerobacter stomatis]|uniref:ParB-like N-terminal domain-containing protein n=1 Tax=Peptoanaerobacter stomatis TaxID=796937 RepID=G9XA60_9FIRM|nr:ParB N-terminal domain-containing protein [Peptoanaerobacter stomatis]EHL20306.1 hypothetical protein HMPREF9628_00151 [Peptoanaerobacter stomatis]
MSDIIKIIYKKVDELIPYINNPRENENAVDYVASSIKNFGFKVPIVIDKQNEIIAGHTRLLAAKKLNLEKVPCIVADELSDVQIKAYRLADNKVSEFAKWDFERLNLELEEISLGDINLDMQNFGFNIIKNDKLDVEDEDFSTGEKTNKKEKVIQCPHCGKDVII